MAQLLRRIDVEAFSRLPVNGAEKLPFPADHVVPHLLPAGLIGGDARLFHRREHRRQRRLDLLEEPQQAPLLQLLPGGLTDAVEEPCNEGAPRRIVGSLVRVNGQSAEGLRQIGQGIGHPRGVQQIRRQRQIEERNALTGESALPELLAVLHRHG